MIDNRNDTTQEMLNSEHSTRMYIKARTKLSIQIQMFTKKTLRLEVGSPTFMEKSICINKFVKHLIMNSSSFGTT